MPDTVKSTQMPLTDHKTQFSHLFYHSVLYKKYCKDKPIMHCGITRSKSRLMHRDNIIISTVIKQMFEMIFSQTFEEILRSETGL